MAALGMQEYDRSGKPVGDFINFKKAVGYDKVKADNGNLNGLSFSYSPSGTSAKVTFTYMTSLKAGIIEYGNTPVSPRSFELIVEVNDFPLSSPSNHVRLDIGVLTASGSSKLEGNSVVMHRQGQEDVYVAASNYAIVGGARTKVSVQMKKGEADTGDVSGKILKTALGGEFDTQIAHIDLPAGASSFVYDPALGSGKNIYAAADFENEESSSHHGSSQGSTTDASGSQASSSKQKENGVEDDESEGEGGLNTISYALIAVGAVAVGAAICVLAVCAAKSKKAKEEDEKEESEKDISMTYVGDNDMCYNDGNQMDQSPALTTTSVRNQDDEKDIGMTYVDEAKVEEETPDSYDDDDELDNLPAPETAAPV